MEKVASPSVFVRISTALSTLGKRKLPAEDPDGGAGTDCAPSSKQQHRAPSISFRPWDQADLHRRLRTFRPLTWFSKPEAVGAVACAVRGWCNSSRDTLVCEFCSATVIYPSPSMPYEHRCHAVTMFSEQLVSKHAAHCPWKSSRCEDDLLAFKPSEGSTQQLTCHRFQDSMERLLCVDQLPELDPGAAALVAPHTCGADGGVVRDLIWPVAERQQHQAILQEIHRVAQGDFTPARRTDSTAAPSSGTCTDAVPQMPMTHTQRARLLALLGWDLEPAMANSSSGGGGGGPPPSPRPPANTSSPRPHSLHHLIGKRANSNARGVGQQGCPGTPGPRHSVQSVVLSCQFCQSRVGLWNYGNNGSMPPVGRLRATRPVPLVLQHKATPLEGPAMASTPGQKRLAAACSEGNGAAASGLASRLDGTIAGGIFAGGSRPGALNFTTNAPVPHRFGSATAPPAFGREALAALVCPPLLPTHQQQQQQQGAASSSSSGFATPGKLGGSLPTEAVPSYSPAAVSASATHMVESFDPVQLHRSWCPWTYTGASTSAQPQIKCGWQYLADALSSSGAVNLRERRTPAPIQIDTNMDDYGPVAYQTPTNIKMTLDGIKDTLRRL